MYWAVVSHDIVWNEPLLADANKDLGGSMEQWKFQHRDVIKS